MLLYNTAITELLGYREAVLPHRTRCLTCGSFRHLASFDGCALSNDGLQHWGCHAGATPAPQPETTSILSVDPTALYRAVLRTLARLMQQLHRPWLITPAGAAFREEAE